jgi:LCP family protein required for cell wall assembly
MFKRFLLLTGILILALSACNLPSNRNNQPALPEDSHGKADPITIPRGEVTILLMGSDQRPEAGDFRTDTNVLVVLKKDGTVNLVSFPRDLWVYLPGIGMQRINAAQEFGGFDLVRATYEYNFGFAPQAYVLTNFSGFQSLVDSLGGINVQVGKTLFDARTGYPNGYQVDPGRVHMDGETALWYVRSRKTTSDLDRLRRSQEVILGIGKRLFSFNGLIHLPAFFTAFRGSVVTDLTLVDATNLWALLKAINSNKVTLYAVSSGQVSPFVTDGGADVLVPRPQALRTLLEQALGQ